MGVVALIHTKKICLNYIRAVSPATCLMNKTPDLIAAQQQEEQWRQTLKGGRSAVCNLRVSNLILSALMSSMVKDEYSLSSWCSCWDWLLVRIPYMGTDTSWIWICSSGDALSWETERNHSRQNETQGRARLWVEPNQTVFTHGVSQVRAPDNRTAFLAHFQRQGGCWVPLRAITPGIQHHHLDHCRCHGDAVTDREGDGVVLAGESGVSIE